MKIAQMHAIVFYGDSISNIMRANDEIFKEKNWESYLIADLFSDQKDVYVKASKDYAKEPMLLQISNLFSQFIKTQNKIYYLKSILKLQ